MSRVADLLRKSLHVDPPHREAGGRAYPQELHSTAMLAACPGAAH